MMTTTKRKQRKDRASTRTRIGSSRDILTVKGVPDGYKARWINDVDNNVQDKLDRGYEFLYDREGNLEVGDETVDSSTGTGSTITKNVGNGVTAILMAIPQEYFDEDCRDKAELVNRKEADMLRQLNSGDDGRYGDVSIDK